MGRSLIVQYKSRPQHQNSITEIYIQLLLSHFVLQNSIYIINYEEGELYVKDLIS